MSVHTEIAIPKNLKDYCATRDKVLAMINQAYQLLKAAEKDCNELAHHIFPYEAYTREDFNTAKKSLDKRLWRVAFDKTGFLQIMDAEQKRKFDSDVEKNTPEFTVDNIKSIFLSVAQDADMMFARGLVNVFLRLSKHHVTNNKEPFKIGKKAITGYAFSPSWAGGIQLNYHFNERINDIDRVFKSLDGKKHNPRELETAINGAMKHGNIYEDEYFHIKGFKNGNMHIMFKRDDLLDKANKIIHDYYNGKGLAGERS